ncbi:unnamed protein product [Cyprideis torosa]|uniref:Nitric oxide synthase-interacting protein homolog n=1 Tax=Cyprideis torosa TaxID=163714 RepID=A0A7R8ZMN1_9CRUS|nr:unnamed protein product [Cyprideis torosa]CAG0884762.1 unnamed protein product [Cyprideis torosa]
MTRHGRNATASAVYSYHEKRKDQKSSGYGTLKARISKHGVKDFDCCSLTLQPCRNPVVTPHGYLYDKEAILEYILKKKREISKQIKAFEKQRTQDQRDMADLAEAAKRDAAQKFLDQQGSVRSSTESRSNQASSSVSNMVEGRDKALPSFWIPTMTPQSSKNELKKPEQQVTCPMSGKPLRMKDLIDVKFTLLDEKLEGSKTLIAQERRYKCPVTHDVLSNAVPCVVIKPTGAVVTQECVEKLIRSDMLDPLTGKKLKEEDLIPLQRGGTGYASANQDALEAKHARPAMQAY